MRTLGLIPARGGSKGIARKNLACLAGRPLIAHTIESAKRAASLDRVIVSTNDEEIAAVARNFGAEVPFMRPAELAEDATPDLPVFVHALEWLQQHEGYAPAFIAHLRPTSPLRTPQHIDEAVSLLRDHPDADSVRSVTEPSESPFKMWQIEEGRLLPLLATDRENEPWNLPRQALPTVYWQNACIDVIRYETIMVRRTMSGTRIVPYVMDDVVIDIDTPRDLQLAEWAMTRRKDL